MGLQKVEILKDCRACVMLSCVWLFVTAWTIACQAPLSVEFSRQECWSGLPFSSPGDLLNPGIKPMSPAPCDNSDFEGWASEPKGSRWDLCESNVFSVAFRVQQLVSFTSGWCYIVLLNNKVLEKLTREWMWRLHYIHITDQFTNQEWANWLRKYEL